VGIILNWLREEAREMKRVPVALVLFIALAFYGGWRLNEAFVAERIKLIELQRDTAEARIVRPTAPPVQIQPPIMLFPHVSVRVAIGIATVFIAVVIFAVVSARRASQLSGEIANVKEEITATNVIVENLTKERDDAIKALKEKKREYAIETLERYSHMRFRREEAGQREDTKDTEIQTTVTVRYADYGEDHDLAQRIRNIFEGNVRWPVTLDSSNKPSLPRADTVKVVFDVADTYFTYGPLVHAFAEGDLLGVPIGKRQMTGRADLHHLIVLVLPSVGAKPIVVDPA
jgi:hypothetical protein